jgi:hypothetical protein
MTAPLPSDPVGPALAAAMAAPEFEVLAAVRARVFARLTALWTQLFGVRPQGTRSTPEQIPSSARTFMDEKSTVDFPPEWDDAVDEGLAEVIDAMDRAAHSVQRSVEVDVEPALEYRTERVRDMLTHQHVQEHGYLAVQMAMQQPKHLETAVRGAVSDHLVAEYADAQHAAAAARGPDWGLIWVPERDACVTCLRLAGEVVKPGQAFDQSLTFGKKAYPYGDSEDDPDLTRPPRHPHCRCELHVVHLPSIGAQRQALKREAERSIVKGWARESEADSVRVDAAKQLLARNVQLPKSVLAEARRRLGHPEKFRRAVPSPKP